MMSAGVCCRMGTLRMSKATVFLSVMVVFALKYAGSKVRSGKRTLEKHMAALIGPESDNSLIDYIEGTSGDLLHEATSEWSISRIGSGPWSIREMISGPKIPLPVCQVDVPARAMSAGADDAYLAIGRVVVGQFCTEYASQTHRLDGNIHFVKAREIVLLAIDTSEVNTGGVSKFGIKDTTV